MEISARGFLDERTMRAVQALALFGKAEPKKAFRHRVFCYAFLAALMVLFAILLWEELFFAIACPICAAFCLIGILLFYYTYCIAPRRAHTKSPLANAENLYVFGEDALTVTTQGVDGFYANETRPYTMLTKLTESAEFFFLYLDKIHIYPVEKATLSEEEIREIRRRILENSNVRHQICRY
ncbi:MAG: YcxB family protein [Clostridia bacterium]|nr:YcxB family protein [Clostridia bacterium]